ncbi:uncharacterized protein TRIADDRAFT_52079 [Trichoplax adhaerens]|uniref:CNH domain-containing protein n=1 Tax=Trichoplax adhaerens TaxID=10228 RepID=B3RLQ0_TRIAD|nr:hypothetical protein TRIADDRAFT_52079 [Trichoplax adhaerens]EDV28822.1 hypothetical protein TRIADDRAFT_52079 [Trichoplax adhaerens]|eukprot:XP_002108024.1 hypothetical protein TRIADDRAFT_52079 [Trichoplax adhaerens]
MATQMFDLIPVLQDLKILGDKFKTWIECMDCAGQNIYVGTTDGCVHYYMMGISGDSSGFSYQSRLQQQRIIGVITNYIREKIKGVTLMCTNETPMSKNPSCVEVCIARKKSIQMYIATSDRIVSSTEISLYDPPLSMAMDGEFVCLASSFQYVLINVNNGKTQNLFPIVVEETRPIVKRISQGEFFVNGPSALGMFVTTTGESARAPISLTDMIQSVAYQHPYLAFLSRSKIVVYSIFDQKQKQVVNFKRGLFVCSCDKKIFVPTTKDIHMLCPIPIHQQIKGLLKEGKMDEAIKLADAGVHIHELTALQHKKMITYIHKFAGFSHLQACEFDKAIHEFDQAEDLDFRHIISLYPSLLLDSCQVSFPDDVNEFYRNILLVVNDDTNELQNAMHALLKYLELDTSLLKLYIELCQFDELIEFLSYDNDCDLNESIATLAENERYHALAILYGNYGSIAESLELLIKLASKEIDDFTKPSLRYIAEVISRTTDTSLIWKYTTWLLDHDQIAGIEVFTKYHLMDESVELLKASYILDKVEKYPVALRQFLEYLVFEFQIQKEQYHTKLGIIYIELILSLMKNAPKSDSNLAEERDSLRKLLEESSLFRAQLLLSRIQNTDLFSEQALLYGRMGLHDKALDIIVNRLLDHSAARHYCATFAKGKNSTERKKIYFSLLSVYLTSRNVDTNIVPALELLNDHESIIDPIQALQLIPEDWSIGAICKFLKYSVRSSMNSARMLKVERGLSYVENVQTKHAYRSTVNLTAVKITDDRICQVCNRPIGESKFVRYPNGVIAHLSCSRSKNICPVTGKNFCKEEM